MTTTPGNDAVQNSKEHPDNSQQNSAQSPATKSGEPAQQATQSEMKRKKILRMRLFSRQLDKKKLIIIRMSEKENISTQTPNFKSDSNSVG